MSNYVERFTKAEIFEIIRRNQHTKNAAIVLLSDFLVTDRATAKKIYEEEFEK